MLRARLLGPLPDGRTLHETDGIVVGGRRRADRVGGACGGVVREGHCARPPAVGRASGHDRPPRPSAAAPERGRRLRAGPADLARPADVPDRAIVVGSLGAGAVGAGDLPGLRAGRDDDRAGLRGRLRGGDGRRVPGRGGARDPGDPGQGDDGPWLRTTRRSSRPRSWSGRCASLRISSRAGTAGTTAGSGTRSRPVSRSPARPRCCANRLAWLARPGRGGSRTSRRTEARSPRWHGSSRTPWTTSTSTTGPGRWACRASWPTPCICRTGSWHGSSRPGRGSRTALRRTCSSRQG